MLKTSNELSLIIYPRKISGIIFYALEYYIYLLENNMKIDIIFIIDSKNKNLKNKLIELIIEKYSKYYVDLLVKNIIFTKDRIHSKNILILDYSTFDLLNKKIFYKKCFYNYTNSIESLNLSFDKFCNLKNIIPFGNKYFSLVSNNFPLLINFKMFKKLSNFKSEVFIENKKLISTHRQTVTNFHKNFNTLILFRVDFDRANRLIPESKFYNKKIIIFNHLRINKKIKDSIDYLMNIYSLFLDYPNIYESGFYEFLKEHTKEE